MNLQHEFGPIDIYLFDQLLKGRLVRGMRVLDAGCGGGRNLVHLLRGGFDVWGVDHSAEAVDQTRRLALELRPELPADRFRVLPLERVASAPPEGFPEAFFDFVICNAVLHFAAGEAHFRAMLHAQARVLRPGGVFFARLMSTIGVEHLLRPCGAGDAATARLFALGGEGLPFFLVDAPYLEGLTRELLAGELMDPLKSTVVHGQRTMTTWVVRRG